MAGNRLTFKEVYRGESKLYTFTAIDPITKVPLDIGDAATLEFKVNVAVGPPYAVQISKTLLGGVTILSQVGATKGQFQVRLTGAETVALDPLDYFADVWADISGRRLCLMPPSTWPLRDPVNGVP